MDRFSPSEKACHGFRATTRGPGGPKKFLYTRMSLKFKLCPRLDCVSMFCICQSLGCNRDEREIHDSAARPKFLLEPIFPGPVPISIFNFHRFSISLREQSSDHVTAGVGGHLYCMYSAQYRDNYPHYSV